VALNIIQLTGFEVYKTVPVSVQSYTIHKDITDTITQEKCRD